MPKQPSGKSAKGRQHTAHKNKYIRQWAKTAKNKAKAWIRHLMQHPNDKVAKSNISKAEETLKNRG